MNQDGSCWLLGKLVGTKVDFLNINFYLYAGDIPWDTRVSILVFQKEASNTNINVISCVWDWLTLNYSSMQDGVSKREFLLVSQPASSSSKGQYLRECMRYVFECKCRICAMETSLWMVVERYSTDLYFILLIIKAASHLQEP